MPYPINIIDILFAEKKFKQQGAWIKLKKQIQTNYITASQIGQFAFCPVSYSIQSSFHIPQSANTCKGIENHLEQNLEEARHHDFRSKKRYQNALDHDNYPEIANELNELIVNLRNSALIFPDPNNPDSTFYNKDFAAKPDYIYRKNEECIIIEEKFFYNKSISDLSHPYTSHKMQLAAYLYGIQDINAPTGYLIYWSAIYDHERNYYGIEYLKYQGLEANVFKIERSESLLRKLRGYSTQIRQLNKSGKMDFLTNTLNPAKCASCSCNTVCSHKTGKHDSIDLPYSPKYFKLTAVSFPEELKKGQNKSNDNNGTTTSTA